MTPHVFITRGDLTKLSCDAWLLPTSARFSVTAGWRENVSRDVQLVLQQLYEGKIVAANWGRDRGRVLALDQWLDASPLARPYLVNVGARAGMPADWYMAGVREFFKGVAADLSSRAKLNERALPLVALPLVGTGRGGAADRAGDIVRALLPELDDAARTYGFDIALVTADGPAFAAAQNERRQYLRLNQAKASPAAWPDLSSDLLDRAHRLAEYAAAGSLVLFLGAGVGAGAGLPGWNDLLAELARTAGMTDQECSALGKLDVLDRAGIIASRLQAQQKSIGALISDRFTKTHFSLAHSLLASLPVKEVVTTNYDQLFEMASIAAGHPADVLPYASAARNSRWLLKLHGSIDHPGDIVLSREDYLRYADRRAALAGIVQALLITRHMLFVGFSLSDENFHRIADDVRKAVRGPEQRADPTREFGTALFVEKDALLEELWRKDLHCLSMTEQSTSSLPEEGRRLEVFLDNLLAEASSHVSPLLDDAYEGILSDEEREIRESLRRLESGATPEMKQTPAWRRIGELLDEFRGTSKPAAE